MSSHHSKSSPVEEPGFVTRVELVYYKVSLVAVMLIVAVLSMAAAAYGHMRLALYVIGIGFALFIMPYLAMIALLKTNPNSIIADIFAFFFILTTISLLFSAVTYGYAYYKCGQYSEKGLCQTKGCQWTGLKCGLDGSVCLGGFAKSSAEAACEPLKDGANAVGIKLAASGKDVIDTAAPVVGGVLVDGVSGSADAVASGATAVSNSVSA